MPDSSSRSLSRTFWRIVQVVVVALLVSAALFFGLTRTDVGRDGIRQQVETAFNSRFAGSLSIGTLQGTLIDEVVATDVQLKDPGGRVVAQVDSVVATPRWAALLTSTLSFRSFTLLEPHLRLHRDAEDNWNVQQALQRRSSSTPATESPLDLSLATIRVDSGQVTTTRDGDSPSAVDDNWLFDYTRTKVRDVNLDASVEWNSQDQLVDVEFLSFHLPGPEVTVPAIRGQVVRENNRWSLTRFDATTDQSRLRVTGTLQPSPSSPTPTVDLQIARSRIDHDELRRLVPRLPLHEATTIEGRVGGTLDRMVVSGLTVSHGQSFATLEGSFYDLPDALDVDLTLTESHLLPDDIHQVWPDFPQSHVQSLDPVEATATVKGTATWQNQPRPTFDLAGTAEIHGSQGSIQGPFQLRRTEEVPLQYAATLQADSLDLSSLSGMSALSSDLNGRFEVNGQGTTAQTLDSELDVSLVASRLGGQRMSSAQAHLQIAEQAARGSLSLEQVLGGKLEVSGHLNGLGSTATYEVEAQTVNFDVAPGAEQIPSTQLNASLTTQGQGLSWRSVTGLAQLTVDSSTVRRSNETIELPPHSLSLRLADADTEQPRIQVEGSVATFTLDSPSLGPSLWSTGRVWTHALQRAVQRELDKPAPASSPSPAERLTPSFSTADSVALHSEARAAFAQNDASSPLQVTGSLQLHQPEILHAWWPRLPRHASDLEAEATLTIGLDSLQTSGRVSATHLGTGGRQVHDLEATYQLDGPLQAPLAETMTGSLEMSARRAQLGGLPLRTPKASFTYTARRGTLQVQADSLGAASQLQLKTDVHVAPDRNEFTVRQASVTMGNHEWSNPKPGSALLYSNSIRIAPLLLESPHARLPEPQQMRIEGTLSTAPSDTLSLELQNVLLSPFAQIAGSPRPIGGQAGGQIDITGGWAEPQLAGDLAVQRLSYDRRVLGDLHVQSRYASDSPDLILDASFESHAQNPDSLSGPSLVSGGPQSVEPNRLQMSGRLRLPSWSAGSPPNRSSQLPSGETLDLSVDVERADLFFFEYIFEEKVASVRGFTTGTLHIGGTFQHPLFDANLDVKNGGVDLPQFGLRYQVNGPVQVDRRGIHLQDVTVEDNQGGATVDGSILFNEYQYFSFDLGAQLDGITVLDVPDAQNLPFYGQIRGSGPVTLTGPLSDARLRSESVETTPDSEVYIPASEAGVEDASGFIIFADSTGQIPNLQELTRRSNILSDRPAGEPTFVEGLDIDLNVLAPEGSTVNLVFDPIVGDVVTAVGSGRVQLQRQEGEFFVYGTFNATSGTYLFTAGEVFVRRFSLNEGTITWSGDPTNAQLNLNAEYRTRASTSGLPISSNLPSRIPIKVQLGITGRVQTPQVDLSLARVRDERGELVGSQTLDAILNQPDRTTEYATSVLLTNTFLLTTESFTQAGGTTGAPSENLSDAGFNSVSQLVASQLNRYLGAVLPNVDLNFGLQGEDLNDFDVIYGVALRLLNERLIIRGEGVYTGNATDNRQAAATQGEFVVEVRLSSRVSAEVFYRRSGNDLTLNQTMTNSTGAGLSYQAEFSTWRDLFNRVFGWLLPSPSEEESDPEPEPVARRPDTTDPSAADSIDTSNE